MKHPVLNKEPHLTRRSLSKGLGLGILWYLLSPFLRMVLAESRLSLKRHEESPGSVTTHSEVRKSGTAPMSKLSGKKERVGEAFAGEVLRYNISFWWFKKAAEAKIAFYKKEGGGYLASIEAETLGFIGLITRYRKDIYYSHLEEIEDGKKLRTSLFEKVVTIGKKTRRGFVKLDYNTRTMTMKSWGGGKPERQKEESIPTGITYDDPLSAFFNLRHSAYGKLEGGKEFRIRTFPKKGVSTIYIRIATEEEKTRRLISLKEKVEYLADVRMEKELFGSQTGNVEVLFSKDLIPLKGIVKDVIFFGDIKGTLVEARTKI